MLGIQRWLPGTDGRLQQRAQPRHEEYGGDQLALGRVVVLYAEGLGQDERDGDDATESQDVVLWRQTGARGKDTSKQRRLQIWDQVSSLY